MRDVANNARLACGWPRCAPCCVTPCLYLTHSGLCTASTLVRHPPSMDGPNGRHTMDTCGPSPAGPRSDEEGRIRLWSVHVASYDAGYVSLIAL